MARVLRFLSDPARAHEPGSLDSPEIAFISLAAMAERAQCPGTRRFSTPYEITYSTLLVFPNPSACASLTRSNRRGTDPYARWCGRGGVARRPPIPISGAKRSFAHQNVLLRTFVESSREAAKQLSLQTIELRLRNRNSDKKTMKAFQLRTNLALI
jgi:hypothetical protein